MNTQPLRRQRIVFSILFLMGANLLLGGSYGARQDAWISLFIALVLLLLWGFLLARLSILRPGEDIFDLLELLPSPLRKTVSFVLILFCFGQAAVTIRTYAGFARMVSLQNTDLFFLTAMFCLAAVFFLRRDHVMMCRFSYAVAIPVFFIVLLIFALLVPMFRGELLYPIAYNNTKQIALSVTENLSFPFGNAFLLFGLLYEKDAAGKTCGSWFLSILGAGALSLLILFQNLLLLGGDLAENLNFPYNFSTSLVNVADFFSRLEVFASMFFFLSAVARSSYCLMLAGKGMESLFSVNRRSLAYPLGFLLCGYCLIMFENTNTVFNYLEIFPMLAIPLQFILPFILWMLAEGRKRKESRRISSKSCKSLQK